MQRRAGPTDLLGGFDSPSPKARWEVPCKGKSLIQGIPYKEKSLVKGNPLERGIPYKGKSLVKEIP